MKKEEPEFKVQKQYENRFKLKYQKMLVNMNKALLLNLTQTKFVLMQTPNDTDR